jgi:ABC-type branched-subunit amino acid transport system ATPase component
MLGEIGMPEGTQDLTNILEVADLSVSFEGIQPLRGLSFSVARGASLAVIGPNGAGKTVLFRAIIGAIPFGGSVRWALRMPALAMFRKSWTSIAMFQSPRSIS